MQNICILIPAPDYFEDWSPHIAKLERAIGFIPTYRHWTDSGDLDGFDLILPLIAWGYQRDTARWFTLLNEMEARKLPVANPVNVLRWNSDKTYLLELATQNIATVPTRISPHLDINSLSEAADQFGGETFIVKPPISGGADGTFKIGIHDDIPKPVLGHRMMIQPFMPAITNEGEFSLFYFSGKYSHAIIKRPAKGDFRVQDYFGGTEEKIDAPMDALHLAEAALNAAPAPCLYARIDMVRDDMGMLRIMELELIEPSLFLQFAEDGGMAFRHAVQNYLAR